MNFFGPMRPDSRSPRRNPQERPNMRSRRTHQTSNRQQRPILFDFGPPRRQVGEVQAKSKTKKSIDLNKINGGLKKLQFGLQLLSAFKSKEE